MYEIDCGGSPGGIEFLELELSLMSICDIQEQIKVCIEYCLLELFPVFQETA